MRRVFTGIRAAVAGVLLAAHAQAEGVALVIDNDSAADLEVAVTRLETVGFQVISGSDLTAEEMRAQLAGAQESILSAEAGHVLVFFIGDFAQSSSGAWLLSSEADAPSLALADGQGLRLDIVFEIAALADDRALVLLGKRVEDEDEDAEETLGAGLAAGLPEELDLPEGVGLIRGAPEDVLAVLDDILQPGTALVAMLRRNPDLDASGTLDLRAPFLPEGFAPLARADRRAFEAAVEADTEAAFRAYLAAYPNGLNAQAARAEIERIRSAPDRIEAALLLTRDERRAIQRDLSMLGYDTRGIDGIFGPGTRGSIAGWQEATGRPVTSYLDRDQIMALATQAAERQAEIEAEERARREAAEREDRDFWAATGAAGDEPGLRAYLERYPQGIFAGLARERLDRIAAEAAAAERDRDLEAWRRARRMDTIDAYEAYLRDWPRGEFADLARSRIEERLPPPPTPAPAPEPEPTPAPPEDNQAAAAEAALGLNRATRVLIERRLARLGFDPGPIDGVFDDQTRVAIRQAQERFDLVPTGYVNQDLLTMLVSGLFQEFFD